MTGAFLALLLAASPAAAGPAEDAVAQLRAGALAGDDGSDRAALRLLRQDKAAALRPLLGELGHPDRRVRESAAWVIENLAPLPEGGERLLLERMGSKNTDEGMAAAALLAGLGARDLLYAELDSDDPKRRTRALYAMAKLPFWEAEDARRIEKLLQDPAAMVRDNAVWALGEARLPDYDPAPKLLPLMNTPDEKFCARVCSSMRRSGEDRLPGLLTPLLLSTGTAERTCAAGCFAYLEKAPAASTAALAGLLADPDPGARFNAAVALAKLGAAGPGVAEALAPLLDSEREYYRVQAAWALGLLGSGAKPALAALKAALKNPDQRTRAYAAGALAAAGEAGGAETAELAAGLKLKFWQDRANSAWGLAKLGAAAASCRADLEALLDDDNPEAASQAAHALAAMGAAAKESIPALAAVFGGRYDKGGADLEGLLKKLGPAGPESLPALRAALASKNSGTRQYSLAALRLMGAAAAPAAPELARFLAGDEYEAEAALKTIAAVGPEAAPELAKALALAEYPLSLRAAEALGLLGAPGLARLRAALLHKDDFAVMCAARALGRSGAAAAEALPDLEKLAAHPSPLVRARAAAATARISSKDN